MTETKQIQHSFGLKATIMLITSLTILSGATIAPALPRINEVFGGTNHTEFLSKLLLTIPALAIAVCGTFAGYLVDRAGRIKPLIWALVLFAVAGASGFWLNDLYLILVGRAFLGVAVAVIMTVATTIVGDYFEGAERNKFLGLQGGFMALGGMVFVGAGGILADIEWRYPFLLYFAALLTLPLVLKYLYEPQLKAPKKKLSFRRKKDPSYSQRTVGIIYVTVFIYMVIFYMIPVQIPFLLKEIGIKSNGLIGLAIVVGTIAAACTSFAYARLTRYLHFARIYALGFFVIAIGYAIISYANTYSFVLFGLIISGFGVGTLMPNANLWLLSVVPERIRGSAVGKISSMLFLGQFFSPIFVEPIVDVSSLFTAFLAVAGFLVFLSILFVFIDFEKWEFEPSNIAVQTEREVVASPS